jgi:hypothetical protein
MRFCVEEEVEEDGEDKERQCQCCEGPYECAAAVETIDHADHGESAEDASDAGRQGGVFGIGPQYLTDRALIAEWRIEKPGRGCLNIWLSSTGPELGHCARVIEAEAILILRISKLDH